MEQRRRGGTPVPVGFTGHGCRACEGLNCSGFAVLDHLLLPHARFPKFDTSSTQAIDSYRPSAKNADYKVGSDKSAGVGAGSSNAVKSDFCAGVMSLRSTLMMCAKLASLTA
jgi:hypothetical protein